MIFNRDDEDDEEENPFRYTPDDDSSVNPNTWTPDDDDPTTAWDGEFNMDDLLYTPGLEPVQDPARDGEYIHPLTSDEYPAGWATQKGHIVERDSWTCQTCGEYAEDCSGIYAVLTVDPVKVDSLEPEHFQTRCTECTPDVAQTEQALVPFQVLEDVETIESQADEANTSRESETVSGYWFDTSEIPRVTFFSGPTFLAKLGAMGKMLFYSIAALTLLVGFFRSLQESPTAGVNAAVDVMMSVANVAMAFSNPAVFTATFSVLYVLHLLHRDYWFPWRYHREVSERRGAGWKRLMLAAGVLAGVGFTGLATLSSSNMSTLSVLNSPLASIALAGAYFGVGALTARELDNTLLEDLDAFEMDVRAWMYAASLRVGVFVTTVALTGWLVLPSRVVTAVALVAPVTAFLYLTLRVTTYRHSTPAQSVCGVADDERVAFVASMGEYHQPITSDIPTDSLTGQIRARVDVARQQVERFIYRVRRNDRFDSYEVKHGKY